MGSATILAGNTFIVVTHGLSFTPTLDQIQITPQDDLGGRNFWPCNPTSTTFQINISFADPDTNHIFSWQPVGTGAPIAPPGNFPIAASDVQGALNATYDSVNHVYTVYGLQISDTTVAAHATFANNYLLSMLGLSSLPVSDARYPYAYMAALDIACIRVLVVASGGSLTGAYDYFLGDLRVTRAAPYGAALLRTITGFQADLSKQLVNFSTPIKTADATIGQNVPTYRGDVIGP
jgi:hypothetical protein